MKNKVILSLATLGITCGVACSILLGTKLSNNYSNSNLVLSHQTTNYNASSASPIVGNADSSASAISNNAVAYGTTNSGLGVKAKAPSVSFDFSDFRYLRNESNKFLLYDVNFTAAFDGDSNAEGYYIQMLISADGDSDNPILGIYMTNEGETPSDAPTTGDEAFDVTINTPASNHDYTLQDGTINGLDGDTKYDIAITYGNSQTDREPVSTPTFTTPTLVSNEFDSSTIAYAKNENDYLTISAIDFNFNTDLENISKNGFYVLVTITSSQGDKLAGLYLTTSGDNPANIDSSIEDLLPTQAISSTATSYSVTNLTAQFAANTQYTVNYGIGSGNLNPELITPIGNGVNFTTPENANPLEPSTGSNSKRNDIIGGVVGGVGGVGVLGGSALIGYFLLRRKRKRA